MILKNHEAGEGDFKKPGLKMKFGKEKRLAKKGAKDMLICERRNFGNFKTKRMERGGSCWQNVSLQQLQYLEKLLSYNINTMINKHSQEKNVISPILALNCKEQGQVYLQWNFHGVRNAKIQTSNLFLFRNLVQQQTQNFLEEFYSQSSLGDIIGKVTLTDTKKFKSIDWIERSAFRLEATISEKNLDCGDFLGVLKNILPKFVNRGGLNLINLYDPKFGNKQAYSDYLHEKQSIQSQISKWRKENQCRGTVIFNFLAENFNRNQMDLQKGINYFTVNYKPISSICSTLKKYQNSIRLSKVSLRLKVLSDNFYIGQSKNKGWINTDFNILEKTIFNAPALQYQEKLLICSNTIENQTQTEKINCVIELFLSFLNGDECLTQRQLTLENKSIKTLNMTLKSQQFQFEEIELWKGERVRFTFFEKEHFLQLNSIKNSRKNKFFTEFN